MLSKWYLCGSSLIYLTSTAHPKRVIFFYITDALHRMLIVCHYLSGMIDQDHVPIGHSIVLSKHFVSSFLIQRVFYSKDLKTT